MEYIRKNKKVSITILLILIAILSLGLTFSRYIYNVINNYILESQGFYFNSNTLNINNKDYKINNWDGVNPYTLTIDLNNRKNNLKSTNSDITYEVEVICPNTVTCSSSKTTGVIYKNQKTDSFTVSVTPKRAFSTGEDVTIQIKSTSTSPYEKTLSATYTIGVEKSKFTYNITDSSGSKFLTLNLTNSVAYYQVEKAFASYQVGDQLSMEIYSTLSKEQKANCYSAKVTLTFNPRDILLDMANLTYINRLTNSETINQIDDFNYITGYSFKVDASSSEKVIFYKKNTTKDYTYPITNNNSIVSVSVVTAD